MRAPKYTGMHECCPKDWRKTANITGDYDMDASILHTNNSDMEKRLSMYTRKNDLYGPKTAYSGYSGYSKDD